MARTLQFRRGNTAVASAFTGAEGELFVNTTTDTIHVQDGTTAGGHALAKASDIVSFDQNLNTTDNVTFANIVTSTGQITVPTDTDFALRLNHSTFGEANVIVSSQGYMEVTGGYVGRSFTQILPGEVGATGYFGFTGNITNISGINGLILDTGLEGSGGAWDFDTNGVLTAPGNITTTGTIVSDNGSGYQTLIDPDGITAVYNGNTVYTIAKGSGGGSIVAEEGKSFAIITNGEGPSGKQWTFGTDGSLSLAGKLQFPNGAEIRDTSGDLRLRSSPGNVTQLQGIDGSGFVDSAVKAFYDSGSFVTIHTNIDAGSPEYIWSFDYNGDLTVPNYIKFAGNTFVGDEPGGGPEFRIVTPLGYGATIETDSDMSGNNWVWSFGTDGSLTFPDSTVQTTAWTGTVNYANVSGAYGDSNVAAYTGNISAQVNGYDIGYRDVPQVTAGNVTLALSDRGKHYYSTSAAPLTLTVPSNANVAFPIGTAISIVNKGSANLTVALEAEASMYLVGNATSDSRTITSYGMATLMKTDTDEWFINGTGVA